MLLHISEFGSEIIGCLNIYASWVGNAEARQCSFKCRVGKSFKLVARGQEREGVGRGRQDKAIPEFISSEVLCSYRMSAC